VIRFCLTNIFVFLIIGLSSQSTDQIWILEPGLEILDFSGDSVIIRPYTVRQAGSGSLMANISIGDSIIYYFNDQICYDADHERRLQQLSDYLSPSYTAFPWPGNSRRFGLLINSRFRDDELELYILEINESADEISIVESMFLENTSPSLPILGRLPSGDYWLVNYNNNRKEFLSYYVSSEGAELVTTSAMPSLDADGFINVSFSNQGDKIAVFHDSALEMYDFDVCSGEVSFNSKLADHTRFSDRQRSMDFSMSGDFFYSFLQDRNDLIVMQYDMNHPDGFVNSLDTLLIIPHNRRFGSLQAQLGPDGNIYMLREEFASSVVDVLTRIDDASELPIHIGDKWSVSIRTFSRFPLVFYNLNPDVFQGEFFPVDSVLCAGSNLATELVGDQYIWNTGVQTRSVLINQEGLYKVTVSSGQCLSIDSVNIRFPDVGDTDVLPEDVVLCEADTLTIVLPDSNSYIWDSGLTSSERLIISSGIYKVTVTQSCGQVFSDSIEVVFEDIGSSVITHDTTICDDLSITLTASIEGETYLWDNGSGLRDTVVSDTGSYAVSVQNGACEQIVEFRVSQIENNELLPRDTTLCFGDSMRVTLSDSDSPIWENGSIDAIRVLHESGRYWVDAFSKEGCIVSDSILISFRDNQALFSNEIIEICEGDGVELSVNGSYEEILWSTGEVSPSIVVNESEQYVVSVLDQDCTIIDTVGVNFLGNCNCELYVPNVISLQGESDNTKLQVYSNCLLSSVEYEVFDRWGGRIHVSTDENSLFGLGNSSQDITTGVYIVKVTYQYNNAPEEKISYHTVTCIK